MIIYSNERINGLKGRYINPVFFENVIGGVNEVCTDDKDIKKAYEDIGVKVSPLKPKAKAEKKGK